MTGTYIYDEICKLTGTSENVKFNRCISVNFVSYPPEKSTLHGLIQGLHQLSHDQLTIILFWKLLRLKFKPNSATISITRNTPRDCKPPDKLAY